MKSIFRSLWYLSIVVIVVVIVVDICEVDISESIFRKKSYSESSFWECFWKLKRKTDCDVYWVVVMTDFILILWFSSYHTKTWKQDIKLSEVNCKLRYSIWFLLFYQGYGEELWSYIRVYFSVFILLWYFAPKFPKRYAAYRMQYIICSFWNPSAVQEVSHTEKYLTCSDTKNAADNAFIFYNPILHFSEKNFQRTKFRNDNMAIDDKIASNDDV